jgi:hypothetical protein
VTLEDFEERRGRGRGGKGGTINGFHALVDEADSG